MNQSRSRRTLIFSLILVFSMLSWAESAQAPPKEVLDRPEFFANMEVIENLELLENITDSDLNKATSAEYLHDDDSSQESLPGDSNE